MNTSLAFIARLLMAALFLVSAYNKARGFDFVSGMMAAKGFPQPKALLVLAIALEAIGGLMLVVNWHARLAAVALALFTLVAGAIFHNFWNAAGPDFMNQFNHFAKNIAIVGGLLLVAALPKSERTA